jgi:hypothetical protein
MLPVGDRVLWSCFHIKKKKKEKKTKKLTKTQNPFLLVFTLPSPPHNPAVPPAQMPEAATAPPPQASTSPPPLPKPSTLSLLTQNPSLQ